PPAMPTKPATTQSYFFFSSRRRHTRFSRDWSSDVCSSDLRPLLIFSRDEILSYAKQHHINWREDTSNASTKYLRNKLRHLVVPILKQQNTQFLKSFQNTLTHLHETQFLASQSLKNFEEKCVIKKDDHFIISLEKAYSFKGYKYYLTHFLRQFEFTSALEIEKILQTHSGKVLKNDKFKL